MTIFSTTATMSARAAAIIAVFIALGAAASTPASAATVCAPRKVSATGANSAMSFFAKSRARAAWIRKVSSDPRLGANYAQWLRAGDRRIFCRKIDNRFICLAAAIPCRSGRVVSVSPMSAAPKQSVRLVKPVRPL